MAVRTIRLLGDPILRRRCATVKDFGQAETRKVIRDLRHTLDDFRRRMGFGRGIAAPQIGSCLRIVYIDHQYTGPLINPRIVKKSRSMFSLWDDCFSFPGLLVRLKRHRSIEVRFLNEGGKRMSLTAHDSLAELLQHEIDHLNGILAVDRAERVRDIILRSEKQKVTRDHGTTKSFKRKGTHG